jgi:hypothetical protein
MQQPMAGHPTSARRTISLQPSERRTHSEPQALEKRAGREALLALSNQEVLARVVEATSMQSFVGG